MLSSHLCVGLPKGLFPSDLQPKPCKHLTHSCHMPPPHPPWFNHLNCIRCRYEYTNRFSVPSTINLWQRIRICFESRPLNRLSEILLWFSAVPPGESGHWCLHIQYGNAVTSPSDLSRGLLGCNPEDGGSMDLRNVSILPQNYTASKLKKELESSLPWKPETSLHPFCH